MRLPSLKDAIHRAGEDANFARAFLLTPHRFKEEFALSEGQLFLLEAVESQHIERIAKLLPEELQSIIFAMVMAMAEDCQPNHGNIDFIAISSRSAKFAEKITATPAFFKDWLCLSDETLSKIEDIHRKNEEG